MIEIIEHGDSGIRVFKYKGQKALQVVGVENAFSALAEKVNDNPFKRIIELGSDYGGLTNLLADNAISNNATIYTFDVNGKNFVSYSDKIKFYNQTFDSAIDLIKSIISSDGRVLVLCDGGNKENEFKTFQQFLKKNDVIMAHDYASNKKIFTEKYYGKIWNWHEFEDSFASFSDLNPFLQNEFEQYVWCIRIKK